MSIVDTVARLAHLLVALAAVLLVAQLGRMAARTVRQPTVVAEIAAGLLIGPAILGLGGQHMLAVLLPADVLGRLRMVGYVGLVLFLVGIGHHLRDVPHRTARTVAWTALGAWLVPLLCGGLFAVWVLSRDDRALRGDAPAPAFVLFVGIGLSVTAIPVLARILVDRGLLDSEVG